MTPEAVVLDKVRAFLIGHRHDWHLTAPWIRLPRVGLHWLGPLAVVGSVLVGWFAFAGTTGLNQNSTFSMWFGSSSILLMAWSFILAFRIGALERFWGGLDSMYRGHRWAGALAIPMMFLHTQIEPRTKGANLIAGASKNAADAAEDLASTGELLLYGLIGLSLLRLVPYRWWKWTHKLFGVPFAFASWHFYTASKPYDNASAWGWYFAAFMLTGLVAYAARVFVRDTIVQGSDYTIVSTEHQGNLTRIELEPNSEPISFVPGQFAFIRIAVKGMSEPHPFSIASAPSEHNLTFYIRHLGDWSARLVDAELSGATVKVEGPYGAFKPTSSTLDKTLWIAGGVGITPFLSSLADLSPVQSPPTLLYACRNTASDPLVSLLQRAAADGLIDLSLFHSGNRLTPASLRELFPDGLSSHHVALCGPADLVKTMAPAAASLGAGSVATEEFDIRQGFGPDRSAEIDGILRSNLGSVMPEAY